MQSCSIMMQGTLFSVCHYLGIRTPFSSQRIAEEPAVCSHEGAIGPCLAMKQQHVLTYFQHSKCVCVCLQPNWEQISEELLNGTYKLIANGLKASAATSVWVCGRHSAITARGLFLSYPLIIWAPVVIQSFTHLKERKKTREVYRINYMSLFRSLFCISVWKRAADYVKTVSKNTMKHLLSLGRRLCFSL